MENNNQEITLVNHAYVLVVPDECNFQIHEQNGPSTFETMNNIHNEAPPVPARPIHDDKGPPNVQAPSRHDEKQDVFVNFNEHNMSTSSGSQNFASTGPATNKATTSPSFHPESRSSGM